MGNVIEPMYSEHSVKNLLLDNELLNGYGINIALYTIWITLH